MATQKVQGGSNLEKNQSDSKLYALGHYTMLSFYILQIGQWDLEKSMYLSKFIE